jgi:hypothetical protein
VNGKTIDHRDFDEFYAEAERLGIATHEGAGVHLQQYGRERYDMLFKVHMVCHAVESMGACMDLIVGGVLERPRGARGLPRGLLRLGAWWLERMDEFRGLSRLARGDAPTRSEQYFARQSLRLRRGGQARRGVGDGRLPDRTTS